MLALKSYLSVKLFACTQTKGHHKIWTLIHPCTLCLSFITWNPLKFHMEVILLYQNKNKHENTFQYMSNSHLHSYKGLLEELEPNPSTYFMIKLYYMKPTKSHVEIILQYQKILIKKTPSILCPSSWAKGWLRPQ